MPDPVVGLYCAVVEWFDSLVSTRTMAARETQAVFNQGVEGLRTWLGALNLGSGEAGGGENPEIRAARPMGVRPRLAPATQSGVQVLLWWRGKPSCAAFQG